MKRTIPPRKSYDYIITPVHIRERPQLRELNELPAHSRDQSVSDLKEKPATRLLQRRLKRQRRFV